MMLKLRMISRLSAAALGLSLLSGCTFISDPVSQMKVPRLSADKASLMAAITSMTPPASSLIRPVAEDDSSIFTEDLNKDGVMETLVFYETPNEPVEIHGLILEKQGDAWVKKLVFDGIGTTLESVELKDVTGDGKLNIIVGYSRGEEKRLVVYRYDQGVLEPLLKEPLSYTKFIVDDLNGDGIQDITVVSFKRNDYANITTYQYSDGGFKALDKLDDIDPYFNNYYNIVAGKVAENKEGIVLDAALESHSAETSVVVMENNKLRVVIPPSDRTLKDRRIVSEDIDGDGIIEIGLLEKPKGWEFDTNADAIPYFNSYYKWDGKDGLTFAMQQYRDPAGRFFINFPPEWHGDVTVDTKSVLDKDLKFILASTGEAVAEVKFFTPAEWEQEKNSGWELWGKDATTFIGYRGKLEQNKNGGSSNSKMTTPIERKGIDE